MAILIAATLVMGLKPASANPDWTKKERKPCTYCHVGSWDSHQYTEAGKYYKDHEFSFKGYVPKVSGEAKAQTVTAASKKNNK